MIDVNLVKNESHHFSKDDGYLTADDALLAAQQAVEQAKATNYKYQKASEKAQSTTINSVQQCTEMSQDAAIRAHYHAARLHDEATRNSCHEKVFHNEAKNFHYAAIKIHQVIKTRYIRARK